MTNEELLQQAKDQVAKGLEYENWEDLLDKDESDDKEWTDKQYDIAALLAIQSAREEALYLVYMTDGSEREELQAVCLTVEDAQQTCIDLRKTAGEEQVFFSKVEPKKLTAPGR